MRNEILEHINDPRELEKLYRSNKLLFKQSFGGLYPELQGNSLADFWQERLNFSRDEISWGKSKDIWFVLLASVAAFVIAKVPVIFSIDEDFFYPRNIGFIVLPALMVYFGWKNQLATNKIIFIAAATLAGLLFINLLPDNKSSDTLMLACMHLALFLWCLLGVAFVGGFANNADKRLGYLKYNGDLVVMTTLILIAFGIMSGLTVGLFSLIGFSIEKNYFEYVGVFGLAAAPIVGTYLTRTNPQLVGKVSPVIAKIFSPLVLVMLVIYLAAMIYSGKNPYNDREFLMIFNALLIGVMAIIFFSVSGTTAQKTNLELWVLLLLSVVTIVVNGIALSAIVYRISTMGLTPNRAAVLGGNALILVNLLLVAWQLYRVVAKQADEDRVGKVISSYLPLYFAWTIVVTFLFPLLFGFR